jgi:diaminopimelate decarboxylase
VDLPDLAPGSLLAFGMTGAYGFTEAMAPFLSHAVPQEVWEA